MTPWRAFLAIIGALSAAYIFATMTRLIIYNPVVMIGVGVIPVWSIGVVAVVAGCIAGLCLVFLLREWGWYTVAEKPQKQLPDRKNAEIRD